jgi:parallel beta-helix repeat protein
MNMKKTALIFPLIICLILPALLIGLNLVPKVYAQNTVYIRADGRVDPETAPISTLDNVTYTLTGTISESIVIQRNNIVLDGAGHTVDGSGLGRGLDLTSVQNITIKNTNVVGFYYGIQLNLSSLITITKCNVTQNAYDGVRLVQSSYNNISQDRISNNGNDGLKLLNSSSNNIIAENTIALNNDDGIQFSDSPQNTISENTVTQNSDAGIYLLNSPTTIIIGNTIMNNRQGLQIDASSSNNVDGNTFNSNVLYGISLSSSSDNVFEKNVINSNFDGVYAYQSLGNVLSENEIHENGEYGVWLDYSSNCTLSLNNITGNTQAGVYVRYSPGTIISDNTVSNSNGGISLAGSSNNFILGNTIANNNNGLALAFGSTINRVYHNNFVNNTQQASSTSVVIWTNGLEGNYWSDYAGSDLNLNGIGDSPYATGTGNDIYPLMGMFHTFSTSLGYNVNVISNSTIDDFDYERLPGVITIVMHVSNMTSSQTMGMCRVTIPHYLMTQPYNVTINGAQPNYVNYSVYDNGTDRWIYFNYNHSTLEVIINGIETIPPEISVVSPENKTYAKTDVPLIFTVNETTSWMGYSLDGQANVTILGNTTLTGLSEGSHDIIVYANDTFGNMGASATVYFSVDTLPPTVMVLSPENTTYYTGSVMLTFSVSEPVSWMGYSLDGQANATIAGNTTLSGLPNGSHSIIVYANDTAGNMGASSMIYFTIAKVPTITILSPQDMTYTTADVNLTFTIDATVSWMGYSLDGLANMTITGNVTLLGLSDGAHNVLVYANDTLGNMASSNIVYFSVDTTPPSITILSPLNQTYSTDSVMLTFALDEPTSWIGYSLDAQANVTISGNTTLSSLTDGNHNVIVYAADGVGNVGSSTLVYFSVDTTPPDITDVSQYPPEDNVLSDEVVHINATVTDNLSGVSTVVLNYTTNNGTWFSVTMSHLGGNIWNGTIPGFPYGTTVNYTIIAQDSVGNMMTSEGVYTLQYNVIPEFVSYIALLLLLMTTSLIALALRRSKRIRA